MNLLELPYPSRRSPTVARRGVVATSQPLAALAGLDILRAGGNAVDAAIATATMLAVVEPTSNGLGSDAFALVWNGSHLHGLNGSGRAPASLTLDLVRAAGHTTMPARGWVPVTVPGAPAVWRDLHQRFGRLDFADVLAPAIAAAEQGFAVTPIVANAWQQAARLQASLVGAEFAPWFDAFTVRGRAPRPGDVWRLPDHARTLRRIAQSRADDYYGGEIASQIARFASRTGGFVTGDDLAAHTSTWVEPISTDYRGYDVWEIPPNGQGLTTLLALNILEGFDLGRLRRDSVEAYHLQIEAMKLAFADAHRYIADPEHADVPTTGLLAKTYAAERRALIGDTAQVRQPGDPSRGGTVYLCTADADGMMVSYIQSNYQGFGSGVVVPDTGIALQNRGAGFRLDPDHPNALAPRKRPYHTIIPAFLTRDGQPIGPFGVMGGHMQPQGHLQMVLNTVDWGLNPQASLDAPRWQVTSGNEVLVEHGVPKEVVAELVRLGHDVKVAAEQAAFGRGQIIWRREAWEDPGNHERSLIAGSDPRSDGFAVGY
ncbi:MAG TPA: gamma-glutamyltransferase family protein [Chloroflexota bacterium]|nr:gamma-glutamyltransferase family protein [Chloroflexota bacterium]